MSFIDDRNDLLVKTFDRTVKTRPEQSIDHDFRLLQKPGKGSRLGHVQNGYLVAGQHGEIRRCVTLVGSRVRGQKNAHIMTAGLEHAGGGKTIASVVAPSAQEKDPAIEATHLFYFIGYFTGSCFHQNQAGNFHFFSHIAVGCPHLAGRTDPFHDSNALTILTNRLPSPGLYPLPAK